MSGPSPEIQVSHWAASEDAWSVAGAWPIDDFRPPSGPQAGMRGPLSALTRAGGASSSLCTTGISLTAQCCWQLPSRAVCSLEERPYLVYTCMLVAQSCLTLCGPIDCSPPGACVRGILQARILEWVAISFSQPGIFPTQGSNPGLLHCRQILYHPSHQGSSLKEMIHVRTSPAGVRGDPFQQGKAREPGALRPACWG